jgi:SAM-dependent methyltransferase
MTPVHKSDVLHLEDYSASVSNLDAVSDVKKKFVCSEESMRYSLGIQTLVFERLRKQNISPTIVELGCGTGEPVVHALLNSGYTGVVYGFDINSDAVHAANALIRRFGLSHNYIVRHESFFESTSLPKADYLISDPPYIPGDDPSLLLLPDIWGGPEGNDISTKLLSCGYRNAFLEISSYANPEAVIQHARALGYKIVDFTITQMPLGVYSRQDIVMRRLCEMRGGGKAFFTDNCYLVGSTFFTKINHDEPDLSEELLSCLTSLDRFEA